MQMTESYFSITDKMIIEEEVMYSLVKDDIYSGKIQIKV